MSDKWFVAKTDGFENRPIDFKYQHLGYPGYFTFS